MRTVGYMSLFGSGWGYSEMNRAARWAHKGGGWSSYGPVTHEEAARLHCEFFGRGGLVETVDLEEEVRTIYYHEVTQVSDYLVKSIRVKEANK